MITTHAAKVAKANEESEKITQSKTDSKKLSIIQLHTKMLLLTNCKCPPKPLGGTSRGGLKSGNRNGADIGRNSHARNNSCVALCVHPLTWTKWAR